MKRTFLFAGSLSLLGLVGQAVPAEATESLEIESTPVATEALEETQALEEPLMLADTSVSDLMFDVKGDSIGVVQSVDQLSDVSPTDWAYQALSELITNWNCIAGYPDGTFRGQRKATRYELAAALNECLNTVNLRFATKAELEQVKKLQEEFAAELAVLKGRVDALEARTDVLEDQQFSTTTKLQAEVVMAGQFGDFTDNTFNSMLVPATLPASSSIAPVYTDPSGGTTATTPAIAPGGADGAAGAAAAGDIPLFYQPSLFAAAFGRRANPVGSSNPTAIARVRLNFNSSFTGDDLLQTQLEVGNGGQDFFSAVGLNSPGYNPSAVPAAVGYGSATTLVDLGAVDYAGIDSTVALRRLAYSFKPFGPNATFTFGTNIFPSDFIDFNSYANNSAQDFSSGFFINNPLIIANPVDFGGGAGGAVDWNINGGRWSIRALYVAADAGNATGLSGNCNIPPTAATGAINVNPCGGGLGGDPGQASFEAEFADTWGSRDQNNYAVRVQYSRVDAYNVHQNVVGLNFETTFNNRWGFFGRGGVSIDPQIDDTLGILPGGSQADLFNPFQGVAGLDTGIDNNIYTWMAGFGIKDLVVPGSLLAVAGGMPFMVTNDNLPEQTNIELFYRFPINNNITITPSIMYILDPFNLRDGINVRQVDADNDVIQGLIRATFSF